MNSALFWFWTLIIFASIFWYATLLFYVGAKGGYEILRMVRRLDERPGDDSSAE